MMQAMRSSAKIVFFIVLIFFAGFMIFQGLLSIFSDPTRGGRAAPPGVIATINGENIPMTVFESAYRPKAQELYRTQEDKEPTEADFKKLRDEVWNNLSTLTTLRQEAAKHGITINDREIAEYIRNSPPQELFSVPEFQTEDQFDISKYQTWIQQAATSRDPQMLTYLSDFETQIKQQLLLTRLQNFILSAIKITEDDAKNDFISKNEKINVNYIFVSPDTGFKYTASEEEVLARYELDKDQYKKPEEAILEYIQLNKQPSDEDKLSTKVQIDSIYNKILEGADFADMAKQYSQDGSAQKGGDLGWFTKGRMVDEFYQGTIALKNVNDVSKPIESQFGWHIIQLTGRRPVKDAKPSTSSEMKTEYMASHILIKSQTSEATLETIRTKAAEILRVAEADGLEEAANEFAEAVQETKPFAEGRFIREFGGEVESMMKFSFEADLGDFAEVIETRNGVFITRLKDRSPEGFKPIEEVSERINGLILREKRTEDTHVKAIELAEALKQTNDFQQVSKMAGKPITETGFFARHEFVKVIGNDEKFISAAFSLSADNKYSNVVKSKTGAYLLEFIDFQPAETSQFEAKSDSLTQDMILKKRREAWSKWVNGIRTSAEIEDYRSFYYGG